MSTLGEILEQLHDPAQVRRLIIEAGDVATAVRFDKVAEESSDAGTFALQAVEEFTRRADDEAWVKLIGRVQNANAPAAACLSEMLQWAMAR